MFRCDTSDQLENHLDSCEALLSDNAKELLQCPTLLRNIVLGLIPHDVEDFIASRPLDFPDHLSIISHAIVQKV